jgi:hypothetical protein
MGRSFMGVAIASALVLLVVSLAAAVAVELPITHDRSQIPIDRKARS